MKPVTTLSRKKATRGSATPRNRSRGLQESLSGSPSQTKTKSRTTTTPPPATTRQQALAGPTTTEIHWEPPASFKRPDPATPSKATKADLASPYGKTRRLLPPSRRVDEGDDEMESPPKLVRHSRTATDTRSTSMATSVSKNYAAPASASAVGTSTRPTPSSPRQRTPEGGSPVGYESSYFSPSSHGMHPWDWSIPSPSGGGGAAAAATGATIATGVSKIAYPRLESVRSIASWSMASHSTQAELELYQIEQRSTMGSGVMAPPLWVTHSTKDVSSVPPGTSASGGGATSGLSATQHRRAMLAKSTAGMLRSTRPSWDRAESMQSIGSLTSSMWSLGGMSRTSSRKSVYSWNTASRTSPPDYLRATSSGTYGKPRSIISPNHLVDTPVEAHRPIPAMLKPTSMLDVPTELHATKASHHSHFGEGGTTSGWACGTVSDTTTSYKPSLLEDDYGTEDLWSKPASSTMLLSSIAALGLSHANDQEEEEDDDDDYDGEDDTVAALADRWDARPGGSFMTYHAKYY